ncbi:hypothetical protein NHP200010_14350 [Helicobacter bizzozeronii]|uniref:hypothetical protein n=1 Tax=Helicobacter bizzozeronii TaxID=56877 RepID=UPI00244D8F33|nr:hypothetical protein [Helicobacter bizzozeronii]GMB93708.1 hypothetical protein NHP200010_14350 [Helicobacter bizzozeronii]
MELVPDLEVLFYLKFTEKRLFCFEKQGYINHHLEGIEEVEVEKEQEKEGGKGPIIGVLKQYRNSFCKKKFKNKCYDPNILMVFLNLHR